MSEEEAVLFLQQEWSPDGGTFWKLRQGEFEHSDVQRILAVLATIEPAELLARRFVSLLWYVPIFMQWQVERIQRHGGDLKAYLRAIDAMTAEVERIFGVHESLDHVVEMTLRG